MNVYTIARNTSPVTQVFNSGALRTITRTVPLMMVNVAPILEKRIFWREGTSAVKAANANVVSAIKTCSNSSIRTIITILATTHQLQSTAQMR